jgi:hypothetical protein
MARVTHVKKAQQRYETVTVLDADGNPVKIPLTNRRTGEQKVTKKGRPVFVTRTVADKTKPLPNRACEKCQKEIEVGSPYKWVKPKSGPYGGRLRVRCAACPTWTPAELTSSEFLSLIYSTQDAAQDALSNWDRETIDDLRSALSEFADGLREAAEVRTQAADNMDDGFGHSTSMSEDLRSEGEQVEGRADEVEYEDLGEEWDEDVARQEVLDDADPDLVGDFTVYDWEADEHGLQPEVDAKKEEWADEVASKFEDAVSETGA